MLMSNKSAKHVGLMIRSHQNGGFSVSSKHPQDRSFIFTKPEGAMKAGKLKPWWSRLETTEQVAEFWSSHGIAYEARHS